MQYYLRLLYASGQHQPYMQQTSARIITTAQEKNVQDKQTATSNVHTTRIVLTVATNVPANALERIAHTITILRTAQRSRIAQTNVQSKRIKGTAHEDKEAVNNNKSQYRKDTGFFNGIRLFLCHQNFLHIYKKRPRGLDLFAVRTGLEPATPCVTGMYSNQLNYHTIAVLRVQS